MRIPVIKGIIRRRMLVNFRLDPEVAARQLPGPFRPKLHRGHAIGGVCLIRLEDVRPRGVPAVLGINSENAAHRFAVEWTDEDGAQQEGVFVPRRDTSLWLNHMAGGRIFPGEHHLADFKVTDIEGRLDFQMESQDGSMQVRLLAEETGTWPEDSCFPSLAEASAYFETGQVGWSVTRDPGRLDGLELDIPAWQVGALTVAEAHSSYFAETARFPKGSMQFDHALIMRDMEHQWRSVDDLCCAPPAGRAT
jgi:hypothetical protein